MINELKRHPSFNEAMFAFPPLNSEIQPEESVQTENVTTPTPALPKQPLSSLPTSLGRRAGEMC